MHQFLTALLLLSAPTVAPAARMKQVLNLSDGTRERGQVRARDELQTVHDIDAEESALEHKVVHTEENCATCYQGDVMLPGETDPSGSSLLEGGALVDVWENMSAGRANGAPWPNGVVYFRWKPDIDPAAKQVTEEAMQIWSAKSCVRFEEVHETCSGSRSRCHPVTMGSDKEGCNAHAGYYGQPWQSYNLGTGCHYVGTALHELGHVLGLSHEHERFDRDNYVETVLENVPDTWRRWFKVNPWRTQEAKKLPYDLSSIMHYDAWAFAIDKRYTDPATASIRVKNKDRWGNCKIGQRTQLSVGDTLTVSTLYGCADEFCADRDSACATHAANDMCPGGSGGSEGNRNWMKINCPATCGLCQCKDKSEKCAAFVESGYCPHRGGGTEGNRAWMKQNCGRSCGICGPTDVSCQDQPFIKKWGERHTCARYAGRAQSNGRPYCDSTLIQESCPRSCGACPAEPFC